MEQIKPALNSIIQGNCLDVLKSWPDNFIDLIFTSPPYYGLRQYLPEGHPDYKKQLGLEPTFAEFMERILTITAELKRVLKPSGQLWWNMGDCYGTGSGAGSRDGTKQATNAGSNYYEDKGKKAPGEPKCLMMMPERIAMKMIDNQNWILRNRVVWAKQILDMKERRTKGSVMPSSVKDRFNESWEYLYFFVKNKKYYSDLDAVRLPNQVLDEFNLLGLKNLPTVWLIGSEPHNFRKELGSDTDHFATFPQALLEMPLKFGCPPGGIVLDPFGGSMTTAMMAKKLKRKWLMIELSKEYCELGKKRLALFPEPML